VTALNEEDGARRRFVLVQQAEAVPEGAPARGLGLDTIPEILRERLRRAGARFRALRHVDE
jgi:adenine-specific DNA-methyltransferase